MIFAAVLNESRSQPIEFGRVFSDLLQQSQLSSKHVMFASALIYVAADEPLAEGSDPFFSAGTSLVVETKQAAIWLGWYRNADVDMVIVHPDREAVEAATGRCGCIYDDELQLWLMPKNSGARIVPGSGTMSKWDFNGEA